MPGKIRDNQSEHYDYDNKNEHYPTLVLLYLNFI